MLIPMTLMAAGILLTLWGIAREAHALTAPVTQATTGYAYARCLRTTLVGLSITAAGAGWLWHAPPVVGLACIIGAEELLETSVVVAATRYAAPAPPPAVRR